MLIAHEKTLNDAQIRLVKEGYKHQSGGIWTKGEDAVAFIVVVPDHVHYTIIFTSRKALNY